MLQGYSCWEENIFMLRRILPRGRSNIWENAGI